jgi:hypothetical protein
VISREPTGTSSLDGLLISSTAPKCYTGDVPTQYKRVSVTLTPPLQDARERLQRRGLDASVGELAIAGAQALLADADTEDAEQRKRAILRKRLATRLRTGEGIDTDALTEVRRGGWTRA